MKYVLNKDLPTFKAGTEAWLSKRGNLLTKEDNKEITMYNHSTLAKFPNILTEWFTPVEEKRKAVPDVGEKFFEICNSGELLVDTLEARYNERVIDQGNWRWTQEEAELEVKKRAAIERVRRYLVENDLLEEDKSHMYIVIYYQGKIKYTSVYGDEHYYSPYGRLKDTDLTQFIEDCRVDLLMIHR